MYRPLFAALIAVASTGMAGSHAFQTVPPSRDKAIYGHVSHVGWVVKDVDAVSKAWRSFGVADTHDEGEREVQTAYRGKPVTMRFRRMTARMGTHTIHWIQPLGGPSPLSEFLASHGEGVHHVAYAVPSEARLDEEVKALSAGGAPLLLDGRVATTGGAARFVYLDTASRGGGITTELEYNPPAPIEAGAARNEDPFNKITQFALVVRDLRAVSDYWSHLGLGGLAIERNVSLNRVFRGRPGRFEMLLGWNRAGDVPFEWIQPLVGPSVYEEYASAHHEGFHHLGFNVTDMDAAIARLEKADLNVTMSGGWDVNGYQGRFAYLDAERHGGVTIELLWNKPRPWPTGLVTRRVPRINSPAPPMAIDPSADPGPESGWTLNAPAFEGLLTALDPDRDRAAVAYEQLRLRLIGLLQWWGAFPAEDLADAALDRVARKLQQGTTVPGGSLGGFVRGVARMIVHESNRRSRLLAEVPDRAAGSPPSGSGPALDSLDRCLDALADVDRQLVLRYYANGKAADARRRLAMDLGVSPTALRIRAHRVRQRLERCVSASLSSSSESIGA